MTRNKFRLSLDTGAISKAPSEVYAKTGQVGNAQLGRFRDNRSEQGRERQHQVRLPWGRKGGIQLVHT